MLYKLNLRTPLIITLLVISFLVAGYVWTLLLSSHKVTLAITPLSPTTTQPAPETTNFIVVGDIMLSRNVARHAEKSWKTGWIWENISPFLHSADFIIGNLEWPTNWTEVYSYQKVMSFNALPHLIRELLGMNFAALNLANNHIMDEGEDGITATTKILSEIGIKAFGTGATWSEAWQPQIIERNGIKIAFIGASYAAFNDDGTGISNRVARMQDTKKLTLAIQEAKKEADFVVVMMHWGAEYTREPTKLQKDFAHNAIDAGADMIFGAHPHWTQGIESYQGKYIFYSLGNFVFDQEFSEETKTGFTVRVSLKKEPNSIKIETISLNPILIENYGQPRLISWEIKAKALRDINQGKDFLEVNH